MSNYRFDLTKALAAWRRSLEYNRAFTADDLDELEQHLRDQVVGLVAAGLTEEAAFAKAMREMGDYDTAESEYRKVYWGKVRRRHLLIHELTWRSAMLKNYLKITFRQLKRKPLYTVINVLGLAIGMVCCLLIGLYIQDEHSYDAFQDNLDRLVVLGNEGNFWGRSLSNPFPLGSTLQRDVPNVLKTVRTRDEELSPVVREETAFRGKQHVLFADSTFFEVFSFPLLQGDPATVLNTPDAAVITQHMADAYFGDEDPIGKTLQFESSGSEAHTVTVQGVVANVPEKSTIQFDMVVPIFLLPEQYRREDGWGAYMFTTYALLNDAASLESVNAKLPDVLKSYFEDSEPPTFFALPLADLYLSDLYTPGDFRGQMRYLYIFGSIALFILLIAAINYINLVTAQATQRAREVGVRKTLGAAQGQLMRQFLGESVLLSGTALVIALILTALTLPAFNALFETHLILSVETYGYGLLLLILFVLLVGIGAGTYPAFVLARFQPVRVLRGTGTVQSRGSGWLRKSLVVTQFAISVVLIVSTAVIHQQLRYVQYKNLGFQDEQVVIIDLPTAQAWSMRKDLKREAAMQPGVLSATAADAAPGMFYMTIGHKPEEWSSQAQVELPEDESVVMAPAIVDVDYVQTLGLHLVAGRNFSADQPSDIERAYLINETAARRLGWTPEEAIGKPFKSASAGPEGEVIGVVQDFHIGSLRDPIGPVVIQLHESWHGAGHLIARLTPTAIPETMDHLKALIERVAPDEPFTYQFLDDLFDEMYRTEQRLGKIFTTVAILAIFIACLGLFGLASYAAETRTKEIGIRKVLGASVSAIVALLSKDFIKLVAIAFVLATPLAYVVMHRWLEEFAYHIAISWWVFALAGLAGLVVALLTVSYQSIKAALADPVKSLRYE